MRRVEAVDIHVHLGSVVYNKTLMYFLKFDYTDLFGRLFIHSCENVVRHFDVTVYRLTYVFHLAQSGSLMLFCKV